VKILREEPAWGVTAGADSKVLKNTYECSLSAVGKDTHPMAGSRKRVDKPLATYNELTICLPAEQPSVFQQYICTTKSRF
jgi:hypothetical protein